MAVPAATSGAAATTTPTLSKPASYGSAALAAEELPWYLRHNSSSRSNTDPQHMQGVCKDIFHVSVRQCPRSAVHTSDVKPLMPNNPYPWPSTFLSTTLLMVDAAEAHTVIGFRGLSRTSLTALRCS